MSRSKKDVLSMKEYIVGTSQSTSDLMKKGGGIFSHITEHIGKIDTKFQPISLSHKVDVSLYRVKIKKNPNHFVLVTLGLYSICMKELVICLPKEWPILRFYQTPNLPETLPVLLLQNILSALVRKSSNFILAEGLVFSKLKKNWCKLDWPEGVNGVTLLEHSWDNAANEGEKTDISEDELLTFYTLVPYSCPEVELTSAWYDSMRNAGWDEVAFSFDPRIGLRGQMNQALANEDYEAFRAAVVNGGDVNGHYYYQHGSFGWCSSRSYLLRLGDMGKMKEIKFAIEQGAIVEPSLLSTIARWCTPDDVVFCLDQLGLDINYIDHVGYTALDRAKAFKNKKVCELLVELGGVCNRP